MPTLRSLVLLYCAVMLLASSAQAAAPRAKFVYTKKLTGVLDKDGKAYPVGTFWGKEMLEVFPESTGEAHRLAKEYVRRKHTAGWFRIVSIIGFVGFFPAMAQNNDAGRYTGLGLLATGIGCHFGSRIYRDKAFAVFFRAINAHNEESPLGALTPGAAPAAQGLPPRPGLSLTFAARF